MVLLKANWLLEVIAGEENAVEDTAEDVRAVINFWELVLKVERVMLKTPLISPKERLGLVDPLNGVDENGVILADEFPSNDRLFALGKEVDKALEPFVAYKTVIELGLGCVVAL